MKSRTNLLLWLMFAALMALYVAVIANWWIEGNANQNRPQVDTPIMEVTR